jgi:hypothetical protein
MVSDTRKHDNDCSRLRILKVEPTTPDYVRVATHPNKAEEKTKKLSWRPGSEDDEPA